MITKVVTLGPPNSRDFKKRLLNFGILVMSWHTEHTSSFFSKVIDCTDAIFIHEVESRRLTFLKDTFSRGEKTVVSCRTLSLEGSKKDVREKRRMLSKQMEKKSKQIRTRKPIR